MGAAINLHDFLFFFTFFLTVKFFYSRNNARASQDLTTAGHGPDSVFTSADSPSNQCGRNYIASSLLYIFQQSDVHFLPTACG